MKAGEPSSAIRARVEAARAIQSARFAEVKGVHCNAQMTPKLVREHCQLDAQGDKMLSYAMDIADGVAVLPTNRELMVLIVGCVVAFLVSLAVIKGLMEYVRRHSFSAFGVYRIVLGLGVLLYFFLR